MRVGVVERVGDRTENAKRPLWLELPFAEEKRSQVAPLDVAHGDVELPIDLAGVVDRDHARMVEAGGQLRLAQEPLAKALVVRQLGREQLQRRGPLQPHLLGQVDDAHPAPAEQPFDAVARELAPDFGVRLGPAAHLLNGTPL